MVRTKMIKPTKRNFTRELNIIEPHKDPDVKKDIVNQLMDVFKVKSTIKPKRFVSYSAATILKNWVKPHFADEKKIGFKLGSKGKPAYSPKANCFFGILQYKYEYRKVLQAIAMKVKKNAPLKVLGLSEGKGMTLKKLKNDRIGIKRNITKITNSIDKLVEMYHGKKCKIKWEEVIDVIGFIPEDVNEDPKTPVDYKENA